MSDHTMPIKCGMKVFMAPCTCTGYRWWLCPWGSETVRIPDENYNNLTFGTLADMLKVYQQYNLLQRHCVLVDWDGHALQTWYSLAISDRLGIKTKLEEGIIDRHSCLSLEFMPVVGKMEIGSQCVPSNKCSLM